MQYQRVNVVFVLDDELRGVMETSPCGVACRVHHEIDRCANFNQWETFHSV